MRHAPLLLALATTACRAPDDNALILRPAGATPHGPCPTEHARGEASQMTIVPGAAEGPSVDPPQHCGDARADGDFIRVHGHGARRLDFSRRSPTACDVAEADPAACPTVSIHVFATATLAALRSRLGDANADTIGLGACADAGAPLSQWNVSSRVHDWRFVDEALRVVDAELRRWNIGDDYGLTVTGIACAELL